MSTLLIQIDEKLMFLGIPEEKSPRIRHLYNNNNFTNDLADQLLYSIIRLCSTLPGIVLHNTCVVLVVDLFLSKKERVSLCEVLFSNLKVKSILWMYSALTATLSTGSKDALVIDIGWYETKIIPIADLKILSNLIRISDKCIMSVIEHMHNCLALCASSNSTHASQRDLVPLPFQTFLSSLLTSTVYSFPSEDVPHTMTAQEIVHTIHNSPMSSMPFTSKPTHQCPPETVPFFDNNSNNYIKLPSWISNVCLESLFQGTDRLHLDLVEQALPNLLEQVICSLPLDLRRPLSKKILITGPLASLPGMSERWQSEMVTRGMAIQCLHSHIQTPFLAWYGATISWKSQMGNPKGNSSSAFSKPAFNNLPPSPMLFSYSQYSRGLPLPEWWFPHNHESEQSQ
ncbi:actin-like protein Arp10 [Schizosaccharomyces cryophilus OY26]|uniref:Actin-like protein Arp10 n=1 Tax=Schizosaccharomyces cryophilus (strain OY26 / ATCC MYA-4695 / CBS 11777 / NBRC 106824 / NRRL Y48691) TaxID=653667 RepID=S9W0V8_SCHCR|nr:actin-like protein Arp10 [Schizosaccharomyces cryophilus OY26]EPY53503.1 actin-like protein Arp10 [Schizosaccharomyces cryophilus OY26]